jgi:hypothetical protein
MIFIEGLPCAGKSELIKTLKGNGESVCDELGKLTGLTSLIFAMPTPTVIGFLCLLLSRQSIDIRKGC